MVAAFTSQSFPVSHSSKGPPRVHLEEIQMEAIPCPTRHILHFISLQRGLQHKHSQRSQTAPFSRKALLCPDSHSGNTEPKVSPSLPCDAAGVGRRQSFSSPAFWWVHRQLCLLPCSRHAPGKQRQPQTRTVLPEWDTASPRAVRPFQEASSWLPREGEGTDLHGFEGGDEREHDVVARAARAGQQRAAPAEREQNRARLSRVGNSKDWL